MSSIEKITDRQLFSERLKTLRKSRSKANFAREIGIAPAVYQRYEAGRIPAADHLSVIAERCDTSVDYLLGRTDDPCAPGGTASVPSVPPRSTPVNYPEAAAATAAVLCDAVATLPESNRALGWLATALANARTAVDISDSQVGSEASAKEAHRILERLFAHAAAARAQATSQKADKEE